MMTQEQIEAVICANTQSCQHLRDIVEILDQRVVAIINSLSKAGTLPIPPAFTPPKK